MDEDPRPDQRTGPPVREHEQPSTGSGGAEAASFYEEDWNRYAGIWRQLHPELSHLGDEWIGQEAGAAASLAEYEALIERRFIAPYISSGDTVLEIGVGGGRTAALLLRHCDRLICADVSAPMLEATRARLASPRAAYVKLDGSTFEGLAEAGADVCFCYDTMVHLEPRDIFNYLTLIPRVLRGKRLCIFHHADTLSELGWKKFLGEWRLNLRGQRTGTAFSVMTGALMERFLSHLGYEVLAQDAASVPRDRIFVCRAPDQLAG
jgi:SAM-dependent methyltransferase